MSLKSVLEINVIYDNISKTSLSVFFKVLISLKCYNYLEINLKFNILYLYYELNINDNEVVLKILQSKNITIYVLSLTPIL